MSKSKIAKVVLSISPIVANLVFNFLFCITAKTIPSITIISPIRRENTNLNLPNINITKTNGMHRIPQIILKIPKSVTFDIVNIL